AIDEMLCELMDQIAPAAIILGRRNVGFVPERVQVVLGRQLLRHEAQLHERPDAVAEQAIVNLVNVGKVVDGIARGVFIVETHLVVENRVEADVLESSRSLHLAQVIPITLSQRENRSSRSEHLLPEVREWASRGLDINRNDFGCVALRKRGNGN